MKLILQLFLFSFLIATTVSAQTDNTWTGDGDAISWNDANNWDLDAVPDDTHRAIINIASNVDISGTQEVDQLFINHDNAEVQILSSASLNIDVNPSSVLELDRGTFKNYGQLNIVRYISAFNQVNYFTNESSGTITLSNNGNNGNDNRIEIQRLGVFTNDGIMNLEGTDEDYDVIFNDGIFTNNGELNISGTFKRGFANYIVGEFTNESSGELNASRDNDGGPNASIVWNTFEMENHGTMTIEHPIGQDMEGIGLYLEIDDPFENTGIITISGMSNYGIWYNTNWNNTGEIHLGTDNGNMIGNSDNFPRELNNTSGLITGSGAIRCHDGLVGGTIEIGSSPGQVTFRVTQDLTSVYTPLEIAGTDGPGEPNGHDVIYGERFNSFFDLVDIDISDADLDIELLGGFEPVYGDEFLILSTDGELTGQYGIIGFPFLSDPNLYWELEYDYVDDEVTLVVNAFVVPVKLTDFTAVERDQEHLLEWSTASEINSSHFELQSSHDHTLWNTIGTVSAMGNSSQTKKYSFSHIPIVSHTHHYYRLKMIDLDGTYEYSDIASIRSSISKEKLSVSPNPFTNQITLNEASTFSVIDSYGKIVYTTQNNQSQIDLSFLPAGLYYLKLKEKSGDYATIKLIKI